MFGVPENLAMVAIRCFACKDFEHKIMSNEEDYMQLICLQSMTRIALNAYITSS